MLATRQGSLLALLAGLLAGCGNTDAKPVDYGPLLETLSQRVALPAYRDAAAKADALKSAIVAFEGSPIAEHLADSQIAWRAARRSFRLLDAVHVGPANTLGITARIDASPADDAGIEALVASSSPLDDHAVGAAGGKTKGYLGLEYLLFAAPGGVDPAPVLAADPAAPRRRTLAVSIADEIASSVHQLDDAWEPSGANYAAELERAGKGSNVYPSERAAVDDLFGSGAEALELVVGLRLALPLGKKTGGTPDPSQDPTPRSDSAVNDMLASLDGVIALYVGDGFSSIVRASNSAIDDTVATELDQLRTDLSAIPAPFGKAVVENTSVVDKAYDSGRTLKLTWNTDVARTLGATLQVSDTDGD